MKPAISLRTKISASNAESIKNFSISGSRIIYPGWLKAFPEAAGDDVAVPELAKGRRSTPVAVKRRSKTDDSTQPIQ